MACHHPLLAYRTEDGQVVFSERGSSAKTLELPCGRCIGCRVERARQWTVRVMHEASLHAENCFVTLTYDEQHLPGPSLEYRDFQGFMKRLRARIAPKRVRFFTCGEYGEELLRPHFHCCLFGYAFPDRVVWRDFGSGSVCYRSPMLEELWPVGMSSIGELNRQTAAYCARYVLDKVTGDGARDHYSMVDPDTGEVEWRAPECVRMSLRPGIGAKWFAKFGRTDVMAHDRCVVDGIVTRPPRYYDSLAKKLDPGVFSDVQAAREVRSAGRARDNSYERLAVKERVAKARLKRLVRKL